MNDAATDTQMEMTVVDEIFSPSEPAPIVGAQIEAAETDLDKTLKYLDQVM